MINDKNKNNNLVYLYKIEYKYTLIKILLHGSFADTYQNFF